MMRRPRRPLASGFTVSCGLLTVLLAVAGCGESTAPTHVNATASPAPHSSVVYVALGASDARGVGAYDPARQGYVPVLISRLPPGSHALNLGISGIELHDALQEELPQAVPARPTLMTVWLAANDFKDCVPLDQYHADLETLLATLHSQTHAVVFIADLPDMSQLPAIQHQSVALGPCLLGQSATGIRTMVAQWNAVIAVEARRYGDVLVDLASFNLASNPTYISSDGFHPSTVGYLQLANLFWAAITGHHAVSSA
jgi:acyl-CoA thioesterase I